MDIASLSDDDFLAGFAACTLPPAAFSYLGHLRIAWVHLQRYPLREAIERICAGIDAFARHLGVPQKYNRTLSEALVLLMAAGGGADPLLGWAGFLDRNRDLVDDALARLRQIRAWREAGLDMAAIRNLLAGDRGEAVLVLD